MKKIGEGIDWENLCKRCGKCCVEKIRLPSGKVTRGRPCRYLDLTTRLCRIYKNRFKINPRCMKMTPRNISRLSWLPLGCGYREYYNRYGKGP